MKRNVCGLDRTVRLIGGVVFILATILIGRRGRSRTHSTTVSLWRILAAYTAAELIITGYLQWCPGNYLLGIDTCDQDPEAALRRVLHRSSR